MTDRDGDEATVTFALVRVAEKLRSDPLIARRLQMRNGTSIPNSEPWMAAAERQMVILGIALSALGRGNVRVGDSVIDLLPPGTTRKAAAWRIIQDFVNAEVYLWSADVDRSARQMPLPNHVIARYILPFPITYWSYEIAYGMTDQGDSVENNWMLLVGDATKLIILSDRTVEGVVNVEAAAFKWGTPYPSGFTDEFMRKTAEIILKRLAFVNSPYTDKISAGIPRGIRREAKRLGRELSDSAVRTVTLRRQSFSNSGDSKSAEAFREWHHRWWVTGHFKAQWRPSTRDHKVVWIAPYIKGPDDKPMLEKVYAVVR